MVIMSSVGGISGNEVGRLNDVGGVNTEDKKENIEGEDGGGEKIGGTVTQKVSYDDINYAGEYLSNVFPVTLDFMEFMRQNDAEQFGDNLYDLIARAVKENPVPEAVENFLNMMKMDPDTARLLKTIESDEPWSLTKVYTTHDGKKVAWAVGDRFTFNEIMETFQNNIKVALKTVGVKLSQDFSLLVPTDEFISYQYVTIEDLVPWETMSGAMYEYYTMSMPEPDDDQDLFTNLNTVEIMTEVARILYRQSISNANAESDEIKELNQLGMLVASIRAYVAAIKAFMDQALQEINAIRAKQNKPPLTTISFADILRYRRELSEDFQSKYSVRGRDDDERVRVYFSKENESTNEEFNSLFPNSSNTEWSKQYVSSQKFNSIMEYLEDVGGPLIDSLNSENGKSTLITSLKNVELNTVTVISLGDQLTDVQKQVDQAISEKNNKVNMEGNDKRFRDMVSTAQQTMNSLNK